ncbi:NAD-dependent epimerase/dehydratase family protein [Bacteroidota bacterium]
MINIGITGQAGFIGTNLYNEIGLQPEEFNRIPFEDNFFNNDNKLKEWVNECDIIVHLAAMNRHNDPDVLYKTNIELVEKLINSMKACDSKAHIIFSSSTQEEKENIYGESKRIGRKLLYKFSRINNSLFTGLVIPNVFGPFGHPYYNSFIATFAHQLIHNEQPEIQVDGEVKLIYVGNLCKYIIKRIKECSQDQNPESIEALFVSHDFEKKVSDILNLFHTFKAQYFEKNIIPNLSNIIEINLFNTFRSFIDHEERYPVELVKNTDQRGSFVEIIRLGIGGQVSFSTTVPGITRGNHYHIRKIERFTVIKGKALIQLRRIGSDKVLNFELDGNQPSFVDMPIWYTHNIRNIGNEDLFTTFWINEFYDENDPDTYSEIV